MGVSFRQWCTTHRFAARIHVVILRNLSTLVYVGKVAPGSTLLNPMGIQSASDLPQLDAAESRGMSIK